MLQQGITKRGSLTDGTARSTNNHHARVHSILESSRHRLRSTRSRSTGGGILAFRSRSASRDRDRDRDRDRAVNTSVETTERRGTLASLTSPPATVGEARHQGEIEETKSGGIVFEDVADEENPESQKDQAVEDDDDESLDETLGTHPTVTTTPSTTATTESAGKVKTHEYHQPSLDDLEDSQLEDRKHQLEAQLIALMQESQQRRRGNSLTRRLRNRSPVPVLSQPDSDTMASSTNKESNARKLLRLMKRGRRKHRNEDDSDDLPVPKKSCEVFAEEREVTSVEGGHIYQDSPTADHYTSRNGTTVTTCSSQCPPSPLSSHFDNSSRSGEMSQCPPPPFSRDQFDSSDRSGEQGSLDFNDSDRDPWHPTMSMLVKTGQLECIESESDEDNYSERSSVCLNLESDSNLDSIASDGVDTKKNRMNSFESSDLDILGKLKALESLDDVSCDAPKADKSTVSSSGVATMNSNTESNDETVKATNRTVLSMSHERRGKGDSIGRKKAKETDAMRPETPTNRKPLAMPGRAQQQNQRGGRSNKTDYSTGQNTSNRRSRRSRSLMRKLHMNPFRRSITKDDNEERRGIDEYDQPVVQHRRRSASWDVSNSCQSAHSDRYGNTVIPKRTTRNTQSLPRNISQPPTHVKSRPRATSLTRKISQTPSTQDILFGDSQSVDIPDVSSQRKSGLKKCLVCRQKVPRESCIQYMDFNFCANCFKCSCCDQDLLFVISTVHGSVIKCGQCVKGLSASIPSSPSNVNPIQESRKADTPSSLNTHQLPKKPELGSIANIPRSDMPTTSTVNRDPDRGENDVFSELLSMANCGNAIIALPSIAHVNIFKDDIDSEVGLSLIEKNGATVVAEVSKSGLFDETRIQEGCEILAINWQVVRSPRCAIHTLKRNDGKFRVMASDSPAPPGSRFVVKKHFHNEAYTTEWDSKSVDILFEQVNGLVRVKKIPESSDFADSSLSKGDICLSVDGVPTTTEDIATRALGRSHSVAAILVFSLPEFWMSVVDYLIDEKYNRWWKTNSECTLLCQECTSVTLMFDQETGLCTAEGNKENEIDLSDMNTILERVMTLLRQSMEAYRTIPKERVRESSRSMSVTPSGKIENRSDVYRHALIKLDEMRENGTIAMTDYEKGKHALVHEAIILAKAA